MTKIAIVGFGFMGRTHYGAWKKCRNAKVVAVCDSNLAQLSAKVVGNIAGAADNTALPKNVKIYADFEEMLSAGGFDVVDITLPTPLHRKTTIAALKAGYHVLCEKPMALNLADCDAMLAEATAQTNELVNEHEIMQRAYAHANEVIEQAQAQAQAIVDSAVNDANNIRQGSIQYTDEMLKSLQTIITHSMEGAQGRFDAFLSSMKSSYDIVSSNRKELAAGVITEVEEESTEA